MIELLPVESEEDANVFLGIRRRIDAAHIPSRAASLEHARDAGRPDPLDAIDRLVFRRDVDWLHLRGPLPDREKP